MAATTTASIRSATGSRVSTSTGRSPPGVAANQTSPRRIGPVRPVLRRAPIGHLGERRLGLGQRRTLPALDVPLAREPNQVPAKSLAQQRRPIDSELVRPPPQIVQFRVVNA